MKSVPSEIVFSLSSNSGGGDDNSSELFCYGNGPVKVPGPWKRGRPKGALNKKTTKPTKTRTHQSTEINSRFQFIHTSPHSKTIDPSSRAVIRKHVKQRAWHHYLAHEKDASAKSILEKHYAEIKTPEILGIELECSRIFSKCNLYQIPGVDPFNKSCIKLEPYMHDLLHHFATHIWRTLYPIEDLANINPVHLFWLPMAFQDPALIHSLIGCADIYVSGYRIIRQGGRGLRHLQASIAIVNLRLEKLGKRMIAEGIDDGDEGDGGYKGKEKRLTGDKWKESIEDIGGEEWMDCGRLKAKCRIDMVICLVAAIALLEYGQGGTQNWRIHMRGLKHLVGLAGGIHTLLHIPHILAKVYRADLYGSLDCSETPFFTYHFPPTIQYPDPAIQLIKQKFNASYFEGMDETLKECIQNFESTLFFWSKPTKTEKDAEFVRCVLTKNQYLLLSQKFPLDPKNEFLRITLILFSLTILNERPKDCSVGRKICGIFRERFENLTLDCEGEEGAEVDFLLWAVFLGVCVLRDMECEDREWLVGRLVGICEKGGVKDLGEFKSRLEGFLWVESIHLEGLRWTSGEMKEKGDTEGLDEVIF